MIKREVANELIESAKEFPVVTIIGPRQSGKTVNNIKQKPVPENQSTGTGISIPDEFCNMPMPDGSVVAIPLKT